jgi:hypothetical protein
VGLPHGGWEKIPAVPYTRVKPPSITGDSSYNSSSVDTNTQLIAGYLRRGYLQGVHIMKQYGKSSGGFNSVQLELGTTCRATASDIKTAKTNEICAATAKKLVIAIHSWLNNNRVI